MISLLRSDVYRLSRAWWLRVTAAVVAFLMLAPHALMRWSNMGPAWYDNLTSSALGLDGCQILVAVMAAVATCSRNDLGFDRTVLSSLSRGARVAWFAEKCVLAVLLAGAALVFLVALGLLATLLSGTPVLAPEPAWQVALWLGCTWLCCSVYAVLTVLVAHLTRSEAVALGFAVAASTGALEGGALIGVDALWTLAGGSFLELSSAVSPWLPVGLLQIATQGAGSLLAPDAAASLPAAARVLVVCLPIVAAAVAADALVVSRRDVA